MMMHTRVIGAVAAVLLGVTIIAAVPASADTAGSGGTTSDLMNQSFTASNGLSSQYHVFAAGVPTNRAVGLVMQFHGDGAYEFKNPNSSWSLGGPSGIVAQAKARGMLTIAALSPDKVGSVTWWEQGSANADYVRDLIRAAAFSKYDIDTNNIWLVGYSGGAQFITQFYLPKYSSMVHGGGSIVFGGGGVPRVAVTPFSAGLTSGFRMHWYTGLDDNGANGYNALSDARAGSAYYKGMGFPATLESPAGINHDNINFGKVVGEQLAKYPASPTPTPTPSPTPTPTPVQTPHTITPARLGAAVTLNVPVGTARTTFRVSKSPFGTQVGWYVYTARTGSNVRLAIQTSLTPGTRYYFQVERNSRSSVIASGTFTTLR